MKKLSQQIRQAWPRMDDATKFRVTMLLAARAEINFSPAFRPSRKPRVLPPTFHVTVTERCARCGNLLTWTDRMSEDEVSTEPLLPDRAPRHDA